MNTRSLSVLVSLALGVAGTASAVDISVTALDGTWNSAVPAVTISADGDSARWGDSTGSGRSGYDFEVEPTPFSVALNTTFLLGEFTHLNRPITGTTLSSILLDVAVNFTIDLSPESGTFTFKFDHNETTNVDGDPDASADIVTVGAVLSSDVFYIDSVPYTLNVIGFSTDGGATLTTSFKSFEGSDNSAGLYARFSAPTIPEPSAIALAVAGVLGLVGIARRRR